VPGTNFETVLATYVFDRELRLLLLDAIERIEISLRTTLPSTWPAPTGRLPTIASPCSGTAPTGTRARTNSARNTTAAARPSPNTTGSATPSWSRRPSGWLAS
jgi:hypothetical protein